MIVCQHCGENIPDNQSISNIEREVYPDRVVFITDYHCFVCGGWTRGTQIGYIKDWENETYEAV